MELKWLTDPHFDLLDIWQIQKFLKEIQPDTALLITGDISNYRQIADHLRMLVNQIDSMLFWVAGNHDFYGCNQIEQARKYFTDLNKLSNRLVYLTTEDEPYWIQPGIALVGVDSWADGQNGNFMLNPDAIRDYDEIGDFKNTTPIARKQILRIIGEEQTSRLLAKLEHCETAREVVIAVHVPPFREAHLYQGEISSDEFLPHFTCQSMGSMLVNYALNHPEQKITVLCGHTHHACTLNLFENLTVQVGGSTYGRPAFQTDLFQMQID